MTGLTHLRRTALTAVVGSLLAGGALAATPASAEPRPTGATGVTVADVRDGRCDSGEFCYYYNSDNAGSISDFNSSVPDYGTTQPSCYDFKGPGSGQGRCIKNDAASVWNRSSSKTVRVYFNSNYGGTYQDFGPGAKGNLNATMKNNNASHQFVTGAPPGDPCKTDGSNTRLPSTILVYRVALGRVDRVDFKTYVKNVLPKEWIPSWRAASLESGAMAVKSYGWYWALNSTRDTPGGQCYDVRDDTGDQVYEPGSATSSTNAAVDRTWNVRMTRGGKILKAHYCATSTACGAWVDGDWLSQNGSQTQAVNGRNYRQILTSYYDDIVLTS